MNVIEVKKLSKTYDKFKLDNISFSVPSGNVLGIIGENGAGKSTLIKALLGVIDSDYDNLKFFEKNFKNNEEKIKEDIALIYDTTHYNLEFTPKFIDKLLSKVYQNWSSETYYGFLKRFNLPVDKRLKTYSKGMKMKLEFAIAFSHQAKLLILDEATTGLDPVIRDEILGLLREFTLDEEHCVILSSHITSDLEKIADYIMFIHEGKIIFIKDILELKEDYGIINASNELLDNLNEEDIISIIREPYSNKILVKNVQDILATYTSLVVNKPTIEEIMLFYLKGDLC